MPWPSQDTVVVAQRILKGIRKNCNSIYPSKLFYIIALLNRIFPVIFKIYAYAEFKKFENWLNNRKQDNSQF